VMRSRRLRITGVSKRFGDHEVLRDVDLEVAPGTICALLGPSGSGKTTLLRSIAGLEAPEAGTIELGEQLLFDSRTAVPAEKRRIGMVFQDWALFPHLTVSDNVAYGLSREERRTDRVGETLDLVDLGGLRDRMPSTLSGGQQQRVALARALAPRPRAILLDEPFSNLDTTLRAQVRTEVHRLLAELGITTVFVTHDQEEAFVLGDRVAVMHDGRIEQHATPAEIYDRPASRWVADFVGEANLVRADASGNSASSALGTLTLRQPLRGPVDVLVRPEQLALGAPGDCHGNGDGDGNGIVDLVEFYGHDHVTIVVLDGGTSVRTRSAGEPLFQRGQRVGVRSTAVDSVAFPVG